MQIAVIGSGNIGGTLGAIWADAGHTVIFGARDPQSPKAQAALGASGARARVASIADAVAQAEVVLFAIPGAAMAESVAGLGAALAGKLVIDATNQFGHPVMNAIAAIQQAAPSASIYRAFNSIGAENLDEPQLGGVQADMLYTGPDTAIEPLIAAAGLRPVRVGDLSQAALVDNLGALWGALAYGQRMGRRLAFKVITPGGAE